MTKKAAQIGVLVLLATATVAGCKGCNQKNTGIYLNCGSNGSNRYWKLVPPNTVGCEDEEDGIPGKCYLRVAGDYISFCLEPDEWIGGAQGGADEVGDGDADPEGSPMVMANEPPKGIDPDRWPTDESSLAYLRSQCSRKCESLNPRDAPDPICEESSWTFSGWENNGWLSAELLSDPGALTCVPWYGKNNKAHRNPEETTVVPTASAVPRWRTDGVPIDLACSNFEDCDAEFPGGVLPHLVGGSMDFLQPNESQADFVVVSSASSGSRLQLSVDSPHPSQASSAIGGRLEYSAPDCSQPTCPFYLGNVSLTTNAWDLDTGAETVHVEVVQVGLRRPVLGVWRPSTGEVYLGEKMLDLRIDLDVTMGMTEATMVSLYATNEQEIFGLLGHDGSVVFKEFSMVDDEWTATATLRFDTLEIISAPAFQ
jgi:hypothetical protein